MKKLLLLVFLLTTQMQITAQLTYVPDDNFEQALIDLGYDDVLDDYVLTANISGVTGLSISNRNISDATGIEDFIALSIFNCYNNLLTTLDLTQNTALTYLECWGNQLTSLDVSQNTQLTTLKCAQNALSSLDVSQNTQLTDLRFPENALSSLDISQNTALSVLKCQYNQLTTIDVSLNTALTILECYENQLTTLDVFLNTGLTVLWCDGNQLNTLDISQNTSLIDLLCFDNQLSSLDLRNGNNANMSTMHAYDNPSLEYIWVDDITATYPDCDIPNYLGWCKDEWSEYSLSIDEITNGNNIIIHPNPTQDLINVEAPTLMDKNYIIYSIFGSISKQGVLDSNQIDISILNAGIYLLKIGDVTFKIVKL